MKIPFGDEWKLTVNYTYNDGRDLSNGGDKPLQTLPFHTANGTLDWKPLDDWSFYVTANLYRPAARGERHRQNAGRLHPV
ncbi:colicin I receptor [Klebsiella pneumoniae]|uniref:Colicin I receptor n=1 Tax=Klebsiella pneumoniae TaxID=573 RepID=A0A2X3G4Z3_KLEPN|nr:colicin I receptor [Klebsiella pneumoniae]